MTTVLQIITDAYRQSNLLSINVDPTTAQQAEGLRYLNRIVKSVFGNEAGENFTPFALGNNNIQRPQGFPGFSNTISSTFYIPENMKLMCNFTSATTVYLDPQPDDGARFGVIDVSNNFATYNLTIQGNGRQIEGGNTMLLTTNGVNKEWFYRADLGNWVLISPLSSYIGLFPFPEEFDDMFISLLAMRLNPAYGVTFDQQSAAVLSRSKTQFQARYQQHKFVGSEIGIVRMPRVTADRDYYDNTRDVIGDPQAIFNLGAIW